MPIPQSQLDTWCNQGATVSAQASYASIQAALGHADSSIRYRDYEIYLQGSYRNDTNIYADSDVDIVVQLNETYINDTSRLNEYQKRLVEQGTTQATYTWSHFRTDVLSSLARYHGALKIIDDNKCINFVPGAGRLNADVIPVIKYNLYVAHGTTLATQQVNVIEGVKFWDKTWNPIVNFPKRHIVNGQSKNNALQTGGHYKPIVRMFKNARTYLVGRNRIADSLAPSYFVECMLYNVPDNLFVANRSQAMHDILDWLRLADMTSFMSQNNVVRLFGPTAEQWSEPKARVLLGAWIALWNDWPI
jgi:hypothetical protein